MLPINPETQRDGEIDSLAEWAYETAGMSAENAARLAEALIQLSEEGL